VTGTLFGLGVGPGDPDLITLKALNVLKAAPVIAYPAPDTGDSLARAIAAPHLPGGQIEIVIKTPMVVERFPAQDVYDRYSGEIAAHLDAGQDVALICEGDPFLYGSFMYIYQRLAPTHPVVVVPGVSSVGACAAVAGLPLVSRNQVLSVVPAPLEEEELERRLATTDAAAVMKVGRHLDKVRRVLDRLGRIHDAWYVERATMEAERVLPLTELTDDRAPYFSMILVRRKEEVDR
jgi:precorrin-2/cobalt-factor-2 C20-methyltransferase